MIGHIETIFIIESLSEGELKTGSELYNETLEKYYKYYPEKENKLTIKLFTPNDRESFFDALNYVKYNCENSKLGILMHLEMHGGRAAGLQLSDGSLVDWRELNETLTFINLKTCNRFYICMATCFGRSIYNAIDIKQTSPYSGYISASKEVKPAQILEDYEIIYQNILESHNLILAYEELQAKNPESVFFYKDTDAVFKDLIDYTFDQIKSNPEIKDEFLENVKKDLINNGKDITNLNFEEALDFVQKEYRKNHYPKFTLKNCR